MSDLIKRLRDGIKYDVINQDGTKTPMVCVHDYHLEAADELERKDAAIAELVKTLKWAMNQQSMSYAVRLNQNAKWCDSVDAANAIISKHEPKQEDK